MQFELLFDDENMILLRKREITTAKEQIMLYLLSHGSYCDFLSKCKGKFFFH